VNKIQTQTAGESKFQKQGYGMYLVIPVSPVAAFFAPSILVLKILPASDMKLSTEADIIRREDISRYIQMHG
jgi:hypothetical protein